MPNAKGKLPTFERVSEKLHHEAGVLYWKKQRGRRQPGAVAGRLDRKGYIELYLDGRYLRAHRVVWLLEHGEWPTLHIDHINGQHADNRPENLRQATNAQNQANRGIGRNGFKGITFHKKTGKYQAQIKGRYLGLHSTPEEAARAYDKAALERFGEFARTNAMGKS